MKIPTKQTIYKTINITAITTIITLIILIFTQYNKEQTVIAQELSKVKEDVFILQQSPILSNLTTTTELIKLQQKQIDINTKALAVMRVLYAEIDSKLNMIYDIVKDNNSKLDRHLEKNK